MPTGPVQCAERHMCGPRVIMGGVSFGGVRTSARPQRAERVPVCLGLPGGALAVRSPPGRGGGAIQPTMPLSPGEDQIC